MDSNEKADNIAACLRKTSSWEPGERIDVVRRAATKFGRECLPIGLFKYHMDALIPVIQDADKNPMKWTEGLIEKNFHWSKQMEEVRNFWRGQASILMNGDSSPLNEETMEVSLAVNAIPLVLEVELSSIKTDLIIDSIVQGFENKSRGFSRLNDGNLEVVKYRLSDAASISIDDRALEIADYLRRDLFEYHFVALLQEFPGAPGSAEEHYQVARQAWAYHTSATDRLFWSYQTIRSS